MNIKDVMAQVSDFAEELVNASKNEGGEIARIANRIAAHAKALSNDVISGAATPEQALDSWTSVKLGVELRIINVGMQAGAVARRTAINAIDLGFKVITAII